MSDNEKMDRVDERELYRSPEIVRLGDALELTAGKPDGTLSDGSLKPNGYKDVE